MKKLLLLAFTPLLFSCGNGNPENKPEESKDTSAAVVIEESPAKTEESPTESKDVLGYYVGMFEALDTKPNRTYYYQNKINVSVDSIGGGIIKGHSVVAGNNRPFSGTYTMEGEKYVVEAVEPGDDKYDGKFSFTMNPSTSEVEGTWEANNKKIEVVKRKYLLKKSEFKYDPKNSISMATIDIQLNDWTKISEMDGDGSDEFLTDGAFEYNASVDKLKKEDVENMFKGDLELLRNCIYARHGYSFKNKKMRYIFDTQVDWYTPVTTDVREELTPLEKENIGLIKRYEEHAERYYDNYGR